MQYDMLSLIEGMNNQLKCLTTVITEICNSDEDSVKSEKKAKILQMITSEDYKKQQ